MAWLSVQNTCNFNGVKNLFFSILMQAFNVLQGKSAVMKTNDENVVPKVKTEQYKAFVSVTSTTVDKCVTDENQPPHKDEVDHVAANTSFSGIRYDRCFLLSTGFNTLLLLWTFFFLFFLFDCEIHFTSISISIA